MDQLPNDTLFQDQWYLHNSNGLDLNVIDVWQDYTGAGVEVAIVERAIEYTHPDLSANYSREKDWDFGDNDADPSPRAGSPKSGEHATAVAGIIGASANNNIGIVGVAYGSTLFSFRRSSPNRQKTIENTAIAIDNASGVLETGGRNRQADIVNLSVGALAQEFFVVGREYTALNDAIIRASQVGRGGLGTIMVKAAGNERRALINGIDKDWNQDTNASSWNANPHTISVAAVDRDGFVSSFSNHGASLLVSAFGRGIFTTDRTGDNGYNDSDPDPDYTSSFPGTSASTPMVSGVVALMLEANPKLGWRDVQEILAYSARHVGSDFETGTHRDEQYTWSFNGANDWNGGGLHFSNDYGFGLVDAKAAVRLAETWTSTPQTSTNQATVSSDFLNSPRFNRSPSNITISTEGTSFSQDISSHFDIEHVEVDISFTEWYDLGDLEVHLISPNGTRSTLIDNIGENNGSASGGFGAGRWKFYSNAFRGENTSGTWRIELFDADGGPRHKGRLFSSPMTINDIDITFSGQTNTGSETFIFTEEFSDYAGRFGHSTHIDGVNDIGIHTINAAAVDSSTLIDLANGTGKIDRVSVSIANIQHVVTGDGNDWIVGDRNNNQLFGMRGNDWIVGGDGDDWLDGGAGNDIIYSGAGNDYIVGTSYRSQGNDEIDVLRSGSWYDTDTFVLGHRPESGWGGHIYYNDRGDNDYAVIEDFDVQNSAIDIADRIQLFGNSTLYSLQSGSWNGVNGVGIFVQGDVIGVVKGVTENQLNLIDTNQFVYV